jgi:membrane peptidoglycan carboxypeptidase
VQERNGPPPLARAARLAWCGTLTGTLVASTMLPAAALVWFVAQAWVGAFACLPADLRIPPDAQATRVYARDGRTLLATFYAENRKDVPLARVAPSMQRAVLAAEDIRFYEHGAVDVRSVARALVTDVRGRAPIQGASTLTMQYVRNVRKEDPSLTPQQRRGATADTPVRKLAEMRYAVALESRLSKKDILERYLNIAYFGAGAYGVDAASRTYFDKRPAELTVAEAALLAGLLQSPDTDNPLTGDRTRALMRRGYVLGEMARAGAISTASARRLAATPLALRPTPTPNGCVGSLGAASGAGFFCACPAATSSTTCGTPRTTAGPMWWMSTCATCARSSIGRSAARASTPSAAPVTGSIPLDITGVAGDW